MKTFEFEDYTFDADNHIEVTNVFEDLRDPCPDYGFCINGYFQRYFTESEARAKRAEFVKLWSEALNG